MQKLVFHGAQMSRCGVSCPSSISLLFVWLYGENISFWYHVGVIWLFCKNRNTKNAGPDEFAYRRIFRICHIGIISSRVVCFDNFSKLKFSLYSIRSHCIQSMLEESSGNDVSVWLVSSSCCHVDGCFFWFTSPSLGYLFYVGVSVSGDCCLVLMHALVCYINYPLGIVRFFLNIFLVLIFCDRHLVVMSRTIRDCLHIISLHERHRLSLNDNLRGLFCFQYPILWWNRQGQ